MQDGRGGGGRRHCEDGTGSRLIREVEKKKIIAFVSYCVQLGFSKNLAVFHVDMDHLERKASSSRVMTVNKTILAMCEVRVCCAIGRRKCLDVHNKKFLQ